MGKKRGLPDPEAVLEGRASADLETLVTLIHRANPTGRGLPAEVERRRYARKSALQSLLIRDFGEHLRVEAEAEGVVLLRLLSGRDAAHAVLDALDEDARAWVRYQLDTREAQPAPATIPAARQRLGALARGRRALADYDYSAAEAAFEEAIATGSEAAAIALLELLVDHLAADSRALERAAALERRIRQAEPIRALCALASARLGDAPAVARHVEGLQHPRVAEAWLALGQQRLRLGDRRGARHAALRAEAVDPSSPFAQLLHDLERARSDERAPAEAELLSVVEAEPERAAEVARALLEQWPDSEVAQRVLSKQARQAGEAEARAHLRAGDEAAARGEWHAAQTAFLLASRAAALPGLEARLEEARAQVRAAERAARHARIESTLAEDPENEAALFEWLSIATEGVREGPRRWLLTSMAYRVVEEEAVPIGIPAAPRKVLVARIREAIAAERASQALAEGDPRRAARLGHGRSFESLLRGPQLRALIDASLVNRRLSNAQRDIDEVEARLEAFGASGMGPEEDPYAAQERFEELRGRLEKFGLWAPLERLEEAFGQRIGVEEALADARPLLALRCLERLLDQHPALEPAWRPRRLSMQAEVRRAWPTQRFAGQLAPLPLTFGEHLRPGALLLWTLPEARPGPARFVCVQCLDSLLYLRWVREDGRTHQSALIAPPIRLSLDSVLVDQRGIHLGVNRGDVLELDHEGTPRALISAAQWPRWRRGRTQLLPGEALSWVFEEGKAHLRDHETVRELSEVDCEQLVPLFGPGGAQMLATGPRAPTRLLSARGQLQGHPPATGTLGAARIGERLFLICSERVRADTGLYEMRGETPIEVGGLRDGPESDYALATEGEDLVLLYGTVDGEAEVALVHLDGRPPEPLAAAPRDSRLICDGTGRARARLDPDAVRPLSVESPGPLLSLRAQFDDHRFELDLVFQADQAERLIAAGRAGDREALVRLAMLRCDTARLTGRRIKEQRAAVRRLLMLADERLDAHLRAAHLAWEERRWTVALEHLEVPRAPEDETPIHQVARLRTLLLLQLGRHEAAQGLDPRRTADRELLQLTAALGGSVEPTAPEARSLALHQQAEGLEPERAAALLDQPELWQTQSCGALAPLVEAWLAWSPEAPRAAARRTLGLRYFLALEAPWATLHALAMDEHELQSLRARVRAALQGESP